MLNPLFGYIRGFINKHLPNLQDLVNVGVLESLTNSKEPAKWPGTSIYQFSNARLNW